jgi:hypothetical protein
VDDNISSTTFEVGIDDLPENASTCANGPTSAFEACDERGLSFPRGAFLLASTSIASTLDGLDGFIA